MIHLHLFSITDTNGNFLWNSLENKESIINLKNSIYIRGGERKLTIAAADARDKYVGNGSQKKSLLSGIIMFSNMNVSVNGVDQLIGTDNQTDESIVGVLYNAGNRFIRFPIAPTNGHAIIVSGDASVPILANIRDETSILTYGEYQDIIIDKSITSVSEARARGVAELSKIFRKCNGLNF
jgi:hypothetical protein